MKRLVTGGSALALALLLGPGAVRAQALPPSADPGRVDERIGLPPASPSSDEGLDIPALTPEAAPAGAETVRFQLRAVDLSGNTALRDEDLAGLYGQYLDREVSLATLYEIAAAVTNRYRAEGYILSQALVPAQRIVDGRVAIVVIEGRIDKVTVEGEDSSGRIAALAAEIAGESPLTGGTLERYLLLIQDIAGLRARAVLAPSATVEGAADLTLILSRNPVDGYVSIDNRGSAVIGPYQATVGVNLNNALGGDERIALTVLAAPIDDELYYAQLRLAQPVGSEGTVLALVAARSLTNPGATLTPFENEGEATSFEASVEHPFVRSRALSLRGSITLAWRDATSDFFTASNPTRIYDDHLRVLRAGLSLDAIDDLGGSNSASLTLSQGLNVAGASEKGDGNLSRGNGDPQFTSLSGRVSRLQPLGEEFAVNASGQFQYAFDPLLASEEIGFGGLNFGSAFTSSALSGDSGIGGRLEFIWFWALTPEAAGDFLLQGQSYLFVDGGAIWQAARPTGERARDGLGSAGLGTRFQLERQVFGGWELAFPVDNPADQPKPRSGRLFFQLGASF
ncbi:ShlB/FhaC/HecB family hemolysin secretion/activation protein [Zavarzinia compransoris]|uniref:ShlB/FhaC/HecB family hemolysin secretion/activation protein n=1 Tax=Zavarzinia compransoris TaxID=1264899 RepID=UPI0010E0291F|nr:POTRA domain-containing protein [Zavarzinia compransoris]TDP40360.1 hemolysin activation/secretion protein [Zavarzinia compransoris]